MEKRLKRLLGDGPYPFSLEDNSESPIEAYTGTGMAVLSQKRAADMPCGTHTHSSYEFVIPIINMNNTVVENKPFKFNNQELFPINSGQSHGFSRSTANCRLFTLQIDKDFINDISLQLCNTGNVFFKNEGIKISSELNSLVSMYMLEARNRQTGSDFILNNITNLVVINLLRTLKSNLPSPITEKSYTDRDNINKAINFMRDNYNKSFSLEEVANTANLSPFHFIRVFKASTGKTPYDYLLDIKIEKSKELLKINKHTITEICFRCGFNNLEHFSSVFKRKVGILPSHYRKLTSN